MKKLIFIGLIFALFSCEDPKEVYETSIKTYVISHKTEHSISRGNTAYYIYFQTPTSTESARVDYDTYKKYQVGDTIQVLIKWWEKPKKK